MNKNKICVFDFSHQYDYLREQADYFSDCSYLYGTNAYCSDEAAEKLREMVGEVQPPGIHFIDSGNYHYMSLFFLERVETDFNLLLIDNHTDMNDNAFGDILSCGNWVRKALMTLPHLKNVVILGVNSKYFKEMKESLTSEGKLIENPENKNELIFADSSLNFTKMDKNHVLSLCEKDGDTKKIYYVNSFDEISHEIEILNNAPLYISLDKDALLEEYAVTDWDQGDMSLDTLQQVFSSFDKNNMIGLDICGDTKEGALLNQEVNLKLFFRGYGGYLL